MKTLKFKWTVSKGRDTYGYNICSLYVDGNKVSSCNGGGYDMRSTALADWMEEEFQEDLRRLPVNYGSLDKTKGFYGLSFRNQKTKKRQGRYSKNVKRAHLDGACGFSSMERILKKIGYTLQYVDEGRNYTTYILEKRKADR